MAAVAATELKIPLVVRLEGTNVEAGLKVGMLYCCVDARCCRWVVCDSCAVSVQIIEESNLPGLIAAHNLDDAAIKAVAAI